jgi:glycosyltransferase involved in cell wall biosynthesis
VKNKFNYIVPIFNKEDILPQTLEGIENCSSKTSTIILIVDGCTDNSEQIVDDFIAKGSREAIKILMPNVHMLKSVNAGLKLVREGFSIIMQDDIILQDINMEDKIFNLYNTIKNLGVISFRYGSEIKKTSLLDTFIYSKSFIPMIEEYDFVKSPDDYAPLPVACYDTFYPKMNVINGPNCIPFTLLEKLKGFDENLAPYGFDDPEFCIRALKLNYINGLFPIKYKSDEEWGGTRRSKSFRLEAKKIHLRNRRYIWKKHSEFLKNFDKSTLQKNETSI